MEKFQGKVWKLGDGIDTDIILPTEYLVSPTVAKMKSYTFSPLHPELAGKIEPGDTIVGDKNFGCDSSREQAPEVMKALGIRAVIAKGFACIFFRNAINSGLLLIKYRDLPDGVGEGDMFAVTIGRKIRTNGRDYKIAALPKDLMEILSVGGLVKAMRRRSRLN